MSRESNDIKSHITIEEAKDLGLTKIVKQLTINEKARKGLGLRSLQDEIKDPSKNTRGRPKSVTKLDPSRKLIRANPNKIT